MTTKTRPPGDAMQHDDEPQPFDLSEDVRNRARALRDRVDVIGWERADFIRAEVDKVDHGKQLRAIGILAGDIGIGFSTARSDREISTVYDGNTREEFDMLSIAYFRAAVRYQANPRAVLEWAIDPNQHGGRDKFASVDACRVRARKLREADAGKKIDPLDDVLKLLNDAEHALRSAAQVDDVMNRAQRNAANTLASRVFDLSTGVVSTNMKGEK